MDEVQHAGDLLERALTSFFPQRSSQDLRNLGREIYACIHKRLRGEDLDRDLCRDVFQTFLLNTIKHLQRHGAESVDDLRPWLHALARNAVYHHLEDLFGPKHKPHPPVVSLDDLLAGEAEFYLPPAPPVISHDDDALEHVLLEAIGRLKGRHREFAERHFLHGQSPVEIQHAMHLPSDRAFKRLQRQTVKLLVDIVKTALAYTLASTWVA